MLQPPVSASADRVYFRDGDTNIRYIMPSGLKGDATTVPGGATTVSFFSVSPDDSRIAVVVEDFAAAGSIALRLYVEDLNGGGHHADIYSTTIFADAGGQTLWPMGWHQGQLVLALITACSNEPADVAPTEWHVADASTGKRLATIKGSCGVLSDWPSPSGVACLDHALWGTTVFNWAGKLTATTVANSYNSGVALRQTGLSPSGQRIFWATESFGTCDHSCLPYHTDINVIFRQGYQRFATQHDWPPACLWIDEAHLLGPNTVLAVSLVNGSATIAATELANRGQCAGRYPGGL